MTTPTTKKSPIHIHSANGTVLCGCKGKAMQSVSAGDVSSATCGRCLRVVNGKKATVAPAPAPAPAPVVQLAVVREAKTAKPSKASKAEQAAMTKNGHERVPTFLLHPEYTYTASGKVGSITGLCPVCKKEHRTIAAADAFQVRRCVACQKKEISRRVNEYRKAKRRAAKAAGKK